MDPFKYSATKRIRGCKQAVAVCCTGIIVFAILGYFRPDVVRWEMFAVLGGFGVLCFLRIIYINKRVANDTYGDNVEEAKMIIEDVRERYKQ
jgi:hypothetical protein